MDQLKRTLNPKNLDIRECLEEVHQLGEEGELTPQDFRGFVFTNPVDMQLGMNRDFLKGTVVEEAAGQELVRATV